MISRSIYRRWCGDAKISLTWHPDARPSPEEPSGAWWIQVADAQGVEFASYYLYGRPNVEQLADIDDVARDAVSACDAELVRDHAIFERTDRLGLFVIKPYPPRGYVSTPPVAMMRELADATTRELVGCGRRIRDVALVYDEAKRAANDAAAHLRNKLQAALLFLEEHADTGKDASEALDALRAVEKFADALSGRGGA